MSHDDHVACEVCERYCEDCDGALPGRSGCAGLLVAFVVSWVLAILAVIGAVAVVRRILGFG